MNRSSILLLNAFLTACDDSWAVKESIDPGTSIRTGPTPTPDGGSGNHPGTDGGNLNECKPTTLTHLDIINAPTNAQKVEKTPTLSKLLADGGLPPLSQ